MEKMVVMMRVDGGVTLGKERVDVGAVKKRELEDKAREDTAGLMMPCGGKGQHRKC